MSSEVMTMTDIAALAGVRRPVVSVWRSRQIVAGEPVPFPEPVTTREGVEQFDAAQVVAWLERTGRGNNPGARADAAAYIRPPRLADAAADPAVPATALLCLKVLTDATLAHLEPGELLDLADEADPDDEFLYAEVEALGADLAAMAGYVDALTDAAYDPAGALARLHARRPATSPAARLALAPAALALIGDVGAALALAADTDADTDVDSDTLTITDPTSAVDLTAAVLAALGETLDVRVLVGGDAPVARATRRELLIRGWATAGAADPAPRLTLARFPNPATPAMHPAQVLTAVDEIQLGLRPGAVAIVLGPAAVLCDALDEPDLERHRDTVLRLGRLRFAVRLPAGMVSGAPRHGLGMWVIGDPPTAVATEHRWLAGADLTDHRLTADVRGDLATDMLATLGDPHLAQAHAFRFARIVRTATVLAERGPLVVPGAAPSAPAVVRPAEQVLAARDLLAALDDPRAAPAPLAGAVVVQASDRPPGMPSATLGELIAHRRVRLIAGTRLADDLPHEDGTVRVLTVADLDTPERASGRRVDPLELAARHPGARRTEPGDVVFTTSPRPRAVVDRDGLSVVAAPARILRRAPADRALDPDAVAAAINAAPPGARDPRAWPIPLVDPADAQDLAHTLRLLDDERTKATHRLARLEELTRLLLDGAAQRAIRLTHPHPARTEEGH
ncbi:MAG: hypothetical protein IPL43_08150 [Micropruina sp.]|nr:hypothetical protein [Micropruina sp.]